MQRTISAMVGKGSAAHNSREFIAENVDRERTPNNIEYINEPIKEVYHEMFDEALERYNEKQTRNDRKIDDYYEKIRMSKQEKPFHELIIQIGNKDDMASDSYMGDAAKRILDEYFQGFQERNPNLRVFSAHLHMDEATPHLHIDFIPFTTGSTRGLDTRVSLKKALEAQGFKGGSRSETEWNQWVNSEKEQLARIMEEHNISWEKKGTHEEHLSVMDYKKQERSKELKELEAKVEDKKIEYNKLVNKVDNLVEEEEIYTDWQGRLANMPEFQIPEPTGLMSAKSYKTKIVEPLIQRLKKAILEITDKYYEMQDRYYGLSGQINGLRKENSRLEGRIRDLMEDNALLREDVKDLRTLQRAIGRRDFEGLVKRAKTAIRERERER